MAKEEPLRDLPEPRRQEGDRNVVLRRREADWTRHERSSQEDTGFAIQRAAVDVAEAALAAHDGYTAGHSDDVVTLCGALVRRLGLSEPQRVRLLAAARLHDLGKLAIPQRVLDKPGPLDAGEWALIHDHTLCGQRILESVPELSEVGHIVRHSHERWDGAGYSDGLAGDEIPLESRIIFCADAFHAMRCDRPYRGGRSAAEALEELRRHSGTQFDPAVVAALEQEANLLRGSSSARLAAMTSTMRSKRLVALLLSLVVSGSALAAPGSPWGEGDGGREALASTPAGCADPCVRGSMGALAASQGAAAAVADHRDRGADSEDARPGERSRADDRPGGLAPVSGGAGEPTDRTERGDRGDGGPASAARTGAPLPHQPTPATLAPAPTRAKRPTGVKRRPAPARAEPPAPEETPQEQAPPEPSPEEGACDRRGTPPAHQRRHLLAELLSPERHAGRAARLLDKRKCG